MTSGKVIIGYWRGNDECGEIGSLYACDYHVRVYRQSSAEEERENTIEREGKPLEAMLQHGKPAIMACSDPESKDQALKPMLQKNSAS